jgi:hypothetical protein
VWFWIWTALVVGTLVGAFFLGRRLWRQAVALGRELGRAGEAVAALSERIAELEAIAAREAPDTSATVFDGLEPARARRAALREAAAVRREARQERHRATVRGWRTYWT